MEMVSLVATVLVHVQVGMVTLINSQLFCCVCLKALSTFVCLLCCVVPSLSLVITFISALH